MKRYDQTLKITKTLFVGGVKAAMTSDDVIMTVATMGLIQGFKYNGDLKRGINASIITALAIGVANGAATLVKNELVIKKAWEMDKKENRKNESNLKDVEA